MQVADNYQQRDWRQYRPRQSFKQSICLYFRPVSRILVTTRIENVATANALQLIEAARSHASPFSALITTPRLTYSLKSLNLSIAVIIAFLLLIHHTLFTL